MEGHKYLTDKYKLSASRQVHIMLFLHSLHWLRVSQWIAFRLAVLVYCGWPICSASLTSAHSSDCSAMTLALVGHRTQWSTIGDCAFAAATPAVWNSLPEDVSSFTLLQLFRCRLKWIRAFPAFPGPKTLHVTLGY